MGERIKGSRKEVAMTSKKYLVLLGVIGSLAVGCAQGAARGSSTTSYVPRGQAAQPGSWSGNEWSAVVPAGTPGGRAAQPGSWGSAQADAPRQYALGVPAGQAAQPGGWMKRVQ